MTTVHQGWIDSGMRRIMILFLIALTALFLSASYALAHNVTEGDAGYIQEIWGMNIIPFMYLGAKHMVTGYDHLLFLLGVIFFLFRTRDILLYVSLFTLGHSLTLFFGVLGHIGVNPYLIDAIIGNSVVYKGFDNLGGFQRLFGFQPNTKAAVLIFGLFQGFGLATKLQDFALPEQDLWKNLLAFNIGVEIGQFLALLFILIALNFWRRFNSFYSFSVVSNTLLMTGGFILFGYQMTGYVLNVQQL